MWAEGEDKIWNEMLVSFLLRHPLNLVGFVYVHRWMFHNFSGQPVPEFHDALWLHFTWVYCSHFVGRGLQTKALLAATRPNSLQKWTQLSKDLNTRITMTLLWMWNASNLLTVGTLWLQNSDSSWAVICHALNVTVGFILFTLVWLGLWANQTSAVLCS